MKPCWIAGPWAGSARGRRLAAVLQGEVIDTVPKDAGVCILAGQDYQEGGTEDRARWLTWCARPGRTLLLIPPFALNVATEPKDWSVRSQLDLSPSSPQGILKWIAREVRYCIEGKLTELSALSSSSADGRMLIGSYRKHPHAGLFIITTLPLWSLSLLDHADALREWIEEVHALAGQEQPETSDRMDTAEPEPLKRIDFAVLLHLHCGSFDSPEHALEALEHSALFKVPVVQAKASMEKLMERGFVAAGQVSATGREALEASPYRAYAQALERDPA